MQGTVPALAGSAMDPMRAPGDPVTHVISGRASKSGMRSLGEQSQSAADLPPTASAWPRAP